MFKINVLVITYNQQNVIGRLLDSILCQKEYGLNKIIICDDCSTDNNVEVIQGYLDKYSDYIELYVNEHNLGIYGNAHHRIEVKGEADLFVTISGDDSLCDGWFKTIQEFIALHELDVQNEAFTIYSDWKAIDCNGRETIFLNNKIEDKAYSIMDYRLRGLISLRSLVHTRKMIERLKSVDLTHGVPYAETMYENQYVALSDKNYYCPYIASIYYSGIGFSTKTHTVEYKKDILHSRELLLNSEQWSRQNEYYIKSLIESSKVEINHSFKSFCLYIHYYLKSGSIGMGCSFRSFVLRCAHMFLTCIIRRK